jgi:tetratricopeptide (TPR) repeat protein
MEQTSASGDDGKPSMRQTSTFRWQTSLQSTSYDALNAIFAPLHRYHHLTEQRTPEMTKGVIADPNLSDNIEMILLSKRFKTSPAIVRAKLLYDYAWLFEDDGNLAKAQAYFEACLQLVPRNDQYSRLQVKARLAKTYMDQRFFDTAADLFIDILYDTEAYLAEDPIGFAAALLSCSPGMLIVHASIQLSLIHMNSGFFSTARDYLQRARRKLLSILKEFTYNDPEYLFLIQRWEEALLLSQLTMLPFDIEIIPTEHPDVEVLEMFVNLANWQGMLLVTWEHLLLGEDTVDEILDFAGISMTQMSDSLQDLTYKEFLQFTPHEQQLIAIARNRCFACAEAYFVLYRRNPEDPRAHEWLYHAGHALDLGREIHLIITPARPINSFDHTWTLYTMMLALYTRDTPSLLPEGMRGDPNFLMTRMGDTIDALQSENTHGHLLMRFHMVYGQIAMYAKDEAAMEREFGLALQVIDQKDRVSSHLRLWELDLIRKEMII